MRSFKSVLVEVGWFFRNPFSMVMSRIFPNVTWKLSERPMIGAKAYFCTGSLLDDQEDLYLVYGIRGENFIGFTPYGILIREIILPKATTRRPIPSDAKKYNGISVLHGIILREIKIPTT